MKKLFAFLLALCLCAPSLAGCKQSASLSSEPSVPELPPVAEPSVDEEDAPEPEPTPEVTPEPEPPAPEITPTPEPVPVPTAQYLQCTGNSVNIRAGAGTSFAVLGSAEKNTNYAVLGKSGAWYKTYYRGKIAYISASYASVFTLEKTEEKTEKVIEEGYKLLGVPYVYGAVRFHDGSGKLLAGFSLQKFDCSSLMQYIFYQGAGKLLGLHTRAQVRQGKFVKRADLQRGDCIFFTNEARQYNVGLERVGHVALYLGNNYILHTSSDYARIEKISAKRWSFYIEARRYV